MVKGDTTITTRQARDIARSEKAAGMVGLITVAIKDWHFTIEDGQPAPITGETVGRLLVKDITAIAERITTSINAATGKQVDADEKRLIVAISSSRDDGNLQPLSPGCVCTSRVEDFRASIPEVPEASPDRSCTPAGRGCRSRAETIGRSMTSPQNERGGEIYEAVNRYITQFQL